jgi:hypothetical protein
MFQKGNSLSGKITISNAETKFLNRNIFDFPEVYLNTELKKVIAF